MKKAKWGQRIFIHVWLRWLWCVWDLLSAGSTAEPGGFPHRTGAGRNLRAMDVTNVPRAMVPSPSLVSWGQPASYLLTVTSFLTAWYWVCATSGCTLWRKGIVQEKQFPRGRFGFLSVGVFLFSFFSFNKEGNVWECSFLNCILDYIL